MVEPMSESQTHPDPSRTTPGQPTSATSATSASSPSSQSGAASASGSTDTTTATGEHTRPIPVAERSASRPDARPEQRNGVLPASTTATKTPHQDQTWRHERAEEERRERFGGYNAGADFFGWLVAIALSVLLVSIVGAVVTAVSANLQVDQTEAERRAGTIGLATAIALLVILMVGYYAGGYVAGRMSRYDGGRQGAGVWLIGLFVTIVAVGLGAVFGSQYNIVDRVDLPSVPIPRDTLTGGGIISAVAILVGTLLAAIAGGKVGQRYHRKVDATGL
jgi:hypothetical protein